MTDYITSAALKATLDIQSSETYADADITTAIAAASRVVEAYKGTRFYPTTETRYYTADPCKRVLPIDDANTITSVAIDNDGDGTYETTWTSSTDFYAEPANAALEGKPYNRICVRVQSGRTFPVWQHSVKVIGSFGWAAAPSQVTQATTILAARYLKRARETPYGILTVVGDAVAAAHLGRIDPDVGGLLDSVTADPPILFL